MESAVMKTDKSSVYSRWRNLLERLHFLLDNELERDAIAWLEDGSQFIVEHTGDVKLAQLLGLRVCSVHQVLEALNFECLDESHWDFSIYRHGCFVRGDPHKIEQIAGYDSLSAEKDVVMPNIAYSSELKPLEVRLSLSDSQSQSWEVTIAPSVLPRPAFDTGENFHFQESAVFESSMGESSWGDIFDNSEELSDHDMNSPICSVDYSANNDGDEFSTTRIWTRCRCWVDKGESKPQRHDQEEKAGPQDQGATSSRDMQSECPNRPLGGPRHPTTSFRDAHPVQSAKLLPRVLSYACLRLRDRHAKTTDACVILVSAIALYVLPCPTVSLPDAGKNTQQPFEAVAAVFAKEASAVGEAAIRCLGALLHPVDFDGVSVPGPSTILAHATRIRPFFKNLLADTVAKMDGSTMFATFSPLFLLLQSACQLARDAHETGLFAQLGDDFAPYIGSIYEAIEDSFQCGPRDNWMLRKRGLELLTLMLDVFALQESAWCSSVGTAKEYFQAQLRVRSLVLAGRHDSASVVREAAIPAAMAFECLEKLCPQSSGELQSSTSATSYDFVPPKPPAKPDPSLSPSESTETINEQSFDEHAGDEALPSHETEDDPVHLMKQSELVRSRSKLYMDHAAAPESGDEVDNPSSQGEKSSEDQHDQVQRKGSSLHKVTLKSSVTEPTRPLQSLAGAMQTVETLKQFVAQQRAQTRSRRAQHQNIPQISLPKRRLSRTINQNDDNYGESITEQGVSNTAGSLELTRAEAALEAAQCGEYELAFRLCIVEDDLELLRHTMTTIKTPCMANLSTMARNALCTAFLSFLDGDEGENSSDIWLVLQWLQQWAVDDRRQFERLDPRVVQALGSKLNDMAMTSAKSSLAAAHVVFLLRI
ncbi:hypothetical protein GQ600_11500 [Phytophthora cactorum]|nr:hypothetical protein GQ600_11500 [Phytophthora cactorum]